MRENLDRDFRLKAARQPGRPAILNDKGASLSYAELDQAIDQAAQALARHDVAPGQCIGIHLPSGCDFIIWTYAIWRLGGCVVPIPMELSDMEKVTLLQDIKIDKVVATHQPFSLEHELETAIGIRLGETARLLHPVSRPEHPEAFHDVNAAFIRFTSGTTNKAKGVVLSHETIRERIQAANEALRIDESDRVIWLLSMAYHFTVSIAGYLSLGAAVVLPRSHLAEDIHAAADRHDGTIIYGTPVHYRWLSQSRASAKLTRLRLALSTTSPLDAATGEDFLRVYGVPVTQVLGLIEVGLPFMNIGAAAEDCVAIGSLLPSYRMRLVDQGIGDGSGEVLLAGPGFFDAYYSPWMARDAVMADGWFHTGDLIAGTDGRYRLVGRSKDVIDVFGHKFFPQEIEAFLETHPAVQRALVRKEADPPGPDCVAALVILAEGAGQDALDEIKDHCRKHLAPYKVPQRIDRVTSLPQTASGKKLRRAETPGRGNRPWECAPGPRAGGEPGQGAMSTP